MKQSKYKVVFASELKPFTIEEKRNYLATANLDNLRKFIPEFDERKIDFLGIASSAYVANLVNLNGAAVQSAEATDTVELFRYTPINLDHQRKDIAGVILTSGFSEFGTEKPLSKEEVSKLDTAFNITIGGIVWRVVNNELADYLEEMNNPNRTDKNMPILSSSFEMGFSDFEIGVLPRGVKELSKANIIKDPEEIAKLTPKLKTFGGNGKLNEEYDLAIILKGQVQPLGLAFTESPAGQVYNIATQVSNNQESTEEEENSDQKTNSNITTNPISLNPPVSTIVENVLSALNSKNNETITPEKTIDEQIISQSAETNVKENTNICTNRKNMKITNIKEITDDALKVITASSMVEFVQDELKKASEQWTAEKAEKENAIKEARAKYEELEKTHKELIAQVETIKTNLKTLEDEKVARENQEKFNVRMASFDNKFELTDEDRKVIASQIKDLDNEAFTQFEKNLDVLLKGKNKEVIAAAKKEQEIREQKAKETKEVKASTEDTKEIVENAVNNAKQVTPPPVATTSTEPKTLKEKYAKAFAEDQFEIKYRRH